MGGVYANVHVDVIDSCDSFKKQLLSMIQSRLFLLRDDNFIHFKVGGGLMMSEEGCFKDGLLRQTRVCLE